MPGKKRKSAVKGSSPKPKKLEKSLSVLRRQLTTTEKARTRAKNRADRWRKEAKAQKRAASAAQARVEKLRGKLDGARAALEQVPAAAQMDAMASDGHLAEPTGAPVPDETWSVARLRAEARTRGLTGMSNKTKAQLLAALS